ncbi:hypothetical protein PanWU01x14_121950 [Parasponia andersonii]|uniref:Transmembrane protein n=1 Tax=Parasponia andersonii TaxID=3476 RepID=A0A2P5CUL0_PARAD|nr:hypothetical protein PanWU01x14_121950 [Parasponia andersonii]
MTNNCLPSSEFHMVWPLFFWVVYTCHHLRFLLLLRTFWPILLQYYSFGFWKPRAFGSWWASRDLWYHISLAFRGGNDDFVVHRSFKLQKT